MTIITDEYMQQMLGKTKEYTLVILKDGPNRHREGVEKTIREHARRNFALREEGVLSIVCPVSDASGVDGIGIFNAPAERTRQIMDGDPGVLEGIFVYEMHPCRSFPGDRLGS